MPTPTPTMTAGGEHVLAVGDGAGAEGIGDYHRQVLRRVVASHQHAAEAALQADVGLESEDLIDGTVADRSRDSNHTFHHLRSLTWRSDLLHSLLANHCCPSSWEILLRQANAGMMGLKSGTLRVRRAKGALSDALPPEVNIVLALVPIWD